MGTLTSWGPTRWCLGALRVVNLTALVVIPACASHISDPVASGGTGSVPGAIAAAGASEVEPEPAPVPAFGWCDARPIIAAKCDRCHGDPLKNGAPFLLVEYADTQALDKKGTPRYERMQSAIETDFMPLMLALDPPVEALSEAERQQLIDWLAAAAPLGDAAACPATP